MTFDSISRGKMLEHLLITWYTKKLVQIVEVSMVGSNQRHELTISSYPLPINTGDRQGDTLVSLLFGIVLKAVINRIKVMGHIGIKTIEILACDDDVTIISRNKNCLKKL